MNRLGRVALISGLVAACSSRGAGDSDRLLPTPRSDGASITDSDERIEAIEKVVPDAVAPVDRALRDLATDNTA